MSKTTTPPKNPTPKQIFDDARQSIFYQDDALKALSTVFYYHLEGLRQLQSQKIVDSIMDNFSFEKKEFSASFKPPKFYAQAPIFITGKTGSGKTHMIKQLCKLYDVNFILINTTNLSNAGYKGYTLAEVGDNLLKSANGDTIKAEHSVVFFDEFDKLFLDAQGAQMGVYNRSLTAEILTIVEGATPFPVKEDGGIDSSKMLFIFGGSFNMHQCDEKAVIGFTGEKSLQQKPDTQLKLTDFGLPDELAGRIGKVIAMQDIDEQLMGDILLKSPNSPYVALGEKLGMVDCTVSIEDDALQNLLVAQREAIKKFGVRGLYQGFNELPQLVDILYDAPNFPKTHYTITATGYESKQNEMALRLAKRREMMREQQLQEAQKKYDEQKRFFEPDYDIPF